MMKGRKERITLIGAGLAGSLLGIDLARRGFSVEIFERRPDMRVTEIPAGRSINLALSTRGIHALEEAGVFDAISPLTIPMKGRMIHTGKGECTFLPYGRDETEVIHSVSRGTLNRTLMDAAENHGVEIHFDERCTGIDFERGQLFFRQEVTGDAWSTFADRVIGTDGSASAIRAAMLKIPRFDFEQSYLPYGYKELTIPPGEGGGWRIEREALHIWPRRSFMLIALPNLDGSFTATLFLPFEGETSFEALDSPEGVKRFFETHFPDAVVHLPHLVEEFFGNPTGTLVTIRARPWHVRDRALLLGDAAHAIVPFFGQGMNCAFEDCTVLGSLIERYHPDWGTIFARYSAERKKDTDAIADLALENFVEMRDSVADPHFHLKKGVERRLAEHFPEAFIPRYTLVTFRRIPYSEAKRRGEIQERLLEDLTAGIERPEEVDLKRARRLIRRRLKGFVNPPAGREG
ncbi:MAG: FAD-dependent monooxygenase [Deltaproteobacteria bacterium]|nr:MAG: FAD-dependent monooxygenase [Deltaproteobacteria bacterium]